MSQFPGTSFQRLPDTPRPLAHAFGTLVQVSAPYSRPLQEPLGIGVELLTRGLR